MLTFQYKVVKFINSLMESKYCYLKAVIIIKTDEIQFFLAVLKFSVFFILYEVIFPLYIPR